MNLKSFRISLREKLKEEKLTLSALASLSDLSEDTLRSIIYGKSQDIKLSTLIKIADVLHCSLDELINRYTYPHEVQKIIDRIRKLPKRSLHIIQIVITLEEKTVMQKSMQGKDIIPLFVPKGNFHDGMYYDGNVYESLDITNYPIYIKKETSFALKILTSNFRPFYYPNDILLISANNNPKHHDIVLYTNNMGKIYIRRYTDLGLEPLSSFGEIIPSDDLYNYIPLGVIIRTVNEFDIEQYR